MPIKFMFLVGRIVFKLWVEILELGLGFVSFLEEQLQNELKKKFCCGWTLG